MPRRISELPRQRGGAAIAARVGTAEVQAAPVAMHLAPAPLPASPLRGVNWTVSLIGMLIYILVITANRIPLGSSGVFIALLGAFIQPGKVRFPPYLVWMTIFLIWATLGATQTDFPDAVSKQMVVMYKVLLIVFAAANAVRTRAQLRLFMIFFLACFTFWPLRGAFENYFIFHNTAQGRAIWNLMYSNPNDLATMTMLQLATATALLATEPKGWIRRCAMIGVAILPVLILLTQSRGVYIGTLVFCAITFAGQRRRVRLAIRLAVVLIVMASLLPASVWTRMHSLRHAANVSNLEEVDGAEGSALQRWVIWQVARKIIREHPISGVGIGAYELNHDIYSLGSEFLPTGRGPRDTHSLYLNVIAETGYPGFIIYMAMLISIAVAAEKTRRRCKGVLDAEARQLLTLEAGYAAFMVATVFGSLPYLPHFLLYLVILYAWTRVYNEQLNAMGRPLAATSQAGRARVATPATAGALRTSWNAGAAAGRA